MDWTFEQLEGPVSDRKKLVLSGWSAPFGRPRKDPIIKETIKSRVQTTRYPGGSGQTRHAFGTNIEPTELKGRWMTKVLDQSATANDIADLWMDFVRDERTCRIAWGSIISWTGYIEELELGRESEHEIAWRMRVILDEREDKKKVTTPSAIELSTLVDNLDAMMRTFVDFGKLQLPVIDSLSPDFLDQLDNLAALANGPAALMNKIAGQFDDVVKKTFSTLQHFRGAVTGMRTAILTMRDTVLGATIDSVLLVRTAQSDLAWAKYQAGFDTGTVEILNLLNLLDRNAELQQKQDATRFVTAREGDTWESIAIRATGSATKASSIRALNGARYGEKPVAGTSYLVQ